MDEYVTIGSLVLLLLCFGFGYLLPDFSSRYEVQWQFWLVAIVAIIPVVTVIFYISCDSPGRFWLDSLIGIIGVAVIFRTYRSYLGCLFAELEAEPLQKDFLHTLNLRVVLVYLGLWGVIAGLESMDSKKVIADMTAYKLLPRMISFSWFWLIGALMAVYIFMMIRRMKLSKHCTVSKIVYFIIAAILGSVGVLCYGVLSLPMIVLGVFIWLFFIIISLFVPKYVIVRQWP